MSPEQHLWQKVVEQAFVDATAGAAPSDDARAGTDRRKASDWIRGCGRDFRMVCGLAGMDPDFLSDAFRAGRVQRVFLKNASGSRGREQA
jgi:hypothetical protein